MPIEDNLNKKEIKSENQEKNEVIFDKNESFEESKKIFQNEAENAISEFKNKDKKIEQIEKSIVLNDKEKVSILKQELNIDANLAEINKEADLLREEIFGEEETSLDKAEEKYEKEIMPLLDILKPDNVSLENYEKETMNLLYEDIKEKQKIQDRLYVGPEKEMEEVKELLNSRIKEAINDSNDYKTKNKVDKDFVKKAKIALIYQEDDTDLKRYFGDHENKRLDMKKLKDYIVGHNDSEKFSESDIEQLMKTKFKDNLVESDDYYYFGSYGCCNTIPQSLLVALSESENNKYYPIKEALDAAEIQKYDKETFKKLISKNYGKYAVSQLDKFKDIEPIDIYGSNELTKCTQIEDTIQTIKYSKLDEEKKSLIIKESFKNYLAQGEVNNLYYTLNKINFSEEEKKSKEFRSSVLKSSIKFLFSKKSSYEFRNIKDIFVFSDEEYKSPELEELIVDELKGKIINGNISEFDPVFEGLPLIKDKLTSPLLNESVMSRFTSELSNKNVDNIYFIKNNFPNIMENEFSGEVLDSALDLLKSEISKGDMQIINLINEIFPSLRKKFDSPDVVPSILSGLKIKLEEGNIDSINTIKYVFPFINESMYSKDMVESAHKLLLLKLSGGEIGHVSCIKNLFPSFIGVSSPEISKAVLEGIELSLSNQYSHLGNANINNVIETIKDNKILEGEYKKYLIEALKLRFELGDLSGALRIKNELPIREEDYNIVFDSYLTELEKTEGGIEKIQSYRKIEESSWVNSREKLPEQIRVILEKFENNYGRKGKDLVSLAITAYGIEDLEKFKREMSDIENILNKYNHDNIPEDGKVSMGIEYEVTPSIGNVYSEKNIFDYIQNIQTVSKNANIGQGGGGGGSIYEFTTKPTYNPYILMAEIKLLQEAGFLDLNFEKYPLASRGYHLSLVGDSGLDIGENVYFLHNMMTMSQLTGVTAGNLVNNTKGVHTKGFEVFSDKQQKGQRCEIKGMAADNIEQFERSVITSHNAGIAIQLCKKYMINRMDYMKIPNTAEAFEDLLKDNEMLEKPFLSNQERDIVYEWIKLRNSIFNAVKSHNESFGDSEFRGIKINNDGELIETLNNSDRNLNIDHLTDAKINEEDLIKEIKIEVSDLFVYQKPSFVNALTKINNFYLFKRTIPDKSSYTEVTLPNGTKKKILNLSNINSIWDMKEEGNRLRTEEVSNSQNVSIFDKDNGLRNGYYYIQGASEEMIIHKSQILLNHFNENMEKLLSNKGVKREVEEEVLENA